MLRKIIFFALLLSASSLSFSKNSDSTLTVTPSNPLDWHYINATVSVNQSPSVVNSGITLAVSVGDSIAMIDVIAMNGVRPKIDNGCRHIQISEGNHQLFFELKGDWIIHCRYS